MTQNAAPAVTDIPERNDNTLSFFVFAENVLLILPVCSVRDVGSGRHLCRLWLTLSRHYARTPHGRHHACPKSAECARAAYVRQHLSRSTPPEIQGFDRGGVRSAQLCVGNQPQRRRSPLPTVDVGPRFRHGTRQYARRTRHAAISPRHAARALQRILSPHAGCALDLPRKVGARRAFVRNDHSAQRKVRRSRFVGLHL